MRNATLDEQLTECTEIVGRLQSVIYALEAYQMDLNLGFSDADINELLTDALEEKRHLEELVAEERAEEERALCREYDRVRM